MKRFLATTLLAIAACGGPPPSAPSTTTSSTCYGCCLNGQYYSCSSQSGATQCFNSQDTSGCSRDSSGDAPAGSTSCHSSC